MTYVGDSIDVTSDDFGDLVRRNRLIVDKTLFIKEFYEGDKVSLITRPRRFGKTITLSMLQHFFAEEAYGRKTAGTFDRFLIATVDNGEFLKQHQGQYPVIFISFKDAKKESYEDTAAYIRLLISAVYREHQHCLSSERLSEKEKILFEQYQTGSVDIIELQNALSFLSSLLFTVYQKNVIILIDEYDSPLTNAYVHTPKHLMNSDEGFLTRLSNFMRDLFSAALKTNPYLEKGLLTGILRVSKNTMLSGLNNLEVYTILQEKYAQYFGFTEDEVKELMHYKQCDADLVSVRKFYNGYNIGEKIIYNPWSFMSFLNKRELMPYWVMTSNDKLLSELFTRSDEMTQEQLKSLMLGESISGKADLNLRYEDLIQKPSALWTLLLFCGYLTINSKTIDFTNLNWQCDFRIPNVEILAQYRRIFNEWLEDRIGEQRYAALLTHLLTGDVVKFVRELSDYLMASLSYFDVSGKQSEKFYHGFVLGLIASVRDTHAVYSNKESGKGRYDVCLIPKDERYHVGIILEFKYAKTDDLLKEKADAALKQIEDNHYDAELNQSTRAKDRIKVGISFCDKAVVAVYKHNDSEAVWTDVFQKDEDD